MVLFGTHDIDDGLDGSCSHRVKGQQRCRQGAKVECFPKKVRVRRKRKEEQAWNIKYRYTSYNDPIIAEPHVRKYATNKRHRVCKTSRSTDEGARFDAGQISIPFRVVRSGEIKFLGKGDTIDPCLPAHQ